MDPSRDATYRLDLCQTLTDLSLCHPDASVGASVVTGPAAAEGQLDGVRDWWHGADIDSFCPVVAAAANDDYVLHGTYAAAAAAAAPCIGRRIPSAGRGAVTSYEQQQQRLAAAATAAASSSSSSSTRLLDYNAHPFDASVRLEEFVANVLDGDQSSAIRPDYDRPCRQPVGAPSSLDDIDTAGFLSTSPDQFRLLLNSTLVPDVLATVGSCVQTSPGPSPATATVAMPSQVALAPAFRTADPVQGAAVGSPVSRSDIAARKKIVARRKNQKDGRASSTGVQLPAPSSPSPSKPLRPRDDYSKFVNYVPECLEKFGFCVVDKFAGRTFGTAVMNEVCGLYELGGFEDGLLTSQAFASTEVRGDRVFWLEREDSNRLIHICQLLKRLDNLFLRLHGRLGEYHITSRSKAMLACYPGQARGYRRHVDNPNQDGRVITAIYYLNKDWVGERDGGILRMFPALLPENAVDVEPVFDRVVFFWSDHRTPHEVQPAHRPRYAVTIWYFDDAQRQQARLRMQQESQEDNPRLASVALSAAVRTTLPNAS